MASHGGFLRRPFLRARVRVDQRYRLELEQARAHAVPRSILLGRRLPAPGEPLFLEEDTAGALALAEEERDTCPVCGYLKVWCRDPANQHAFEAREERCWPTYVVALRTEKNEKEGMHPATQRAVQVSARFREGKRPRLDAGLDFDDD